MLPVFYHVPKNAGTYMINNMLLFFREYRRVRTDWLNRSYETARNIEIKQGDKTLMRLIAGDPENWCGHNLKSNTNDVSHFVATEQQAADTINNTWLFAAVVEDDGFSHRNRLISLLNTSMCEGIILREPFSRTKSLYGYVTSDASAHEPSHKSIKGSFEQYIMSDQLECGWVIKRFCGLHDNTQLTTQHYDKTCELLDHMHVMDIKQTDQLIDQVFEQCYDLSRNSFPAHFKPPARHQNSSRVNVGYVDLTAEQKQHFDACTYWDRKLYERYCNS